MIYYDIYIIDLDISVVHEELTSIEDQSWASIGNKIYIDYNWSMVNTEKGEMPKKEHIIDKWLVINDVLIYMQDGEIYGKLMCRIISDAEQNYLSGHCKIIPDNLNTRQRNT